MIRYRDFVPNMLARPGWFKEGDFESFDEALEAVNKWIKEDDIKVVNIETVVLPNIWSKFEEGSADVSLGTSGDSPSRWHQFIRVWYRVG